MGIVHIPSIDTLCLVLADSAVDNRIELIER
jgi:hypothetical protein